MPDFTDRAKAVCSVGDDSSADALGHAWGDALIRWLDDPHTYTTAPGFTCLSGARRYRATRDWRTCGIEGSDGCGAVMRIVPLPIADSGERLTEAALISSVFTHRHPNAREAAVAGCHLVRWLLEGATLDDALVERAIEVVRSLGLGGTVARSLREGVAEARAGSRGLEERAGAWGLEERAGARGLEERAVHPGDGGWRSGSALGLALAAAMRHPDAFATAIELAARIDGDSDSVAYLAGMLLGAAGGTGVLPSSWLEVLPARERIVEMAVALAGIPPERPIIKRTIFGCTEG